MSIKNTLTQEVAQVGKVVEVREIRLGVVEAVIWNETTQSPDFRTLSNNESASVDASPELKKEFKKYLYQE